MVVDGDEILLSTGFYDHSPNVFNPFKFNLYRSIDAGINWSINPIPTTTFGNYFYEATVLHKSENFIFFSYEGDDIFRFDL